MNRPYYRCQCGRTSKESLFDHSKSVKHKLYYERSDGDTVTVYSPPGGSSFVITSPRAVDGPTGSTTTTTTTTGNTSTQEYFCSYCGRPFGSAAARTRHISEVHQSRPAGGSTTPVQPINPDAASILQDPNSLDNVNPSPPRPTSPPRVTTGGGIPPVPDSFSAERYLALYPDVKKDWGGSAWSHYVMHGKKEGRKGDFTPEGWNAQAYLDQNPDVKQNWGGSALSHYLKHGESEGRRGDFRASATFNVKNSGLGVPAQGYVKNLFNNVDKNNDGKMTKQEYRDQFGQKRGDAIYSQYSEQQRKDGAISYQEHVDFAKERIQKGYLGADWVKDGDTKLMNIIDGLAGRETDGNETFTKAQAQKMLGGAPIPDAMMKDGVVSQNELGYYIKDLMDRGEATYASGKLTYKPKTMTSAPPTPAVPPSGGSDSGGSEPVEQPGDVIEPGSPDKGDSSNENGDKWWHGGSIESAIEQHFPELGENKFIPAHEANEALKELGVELPASKMADGKVNEAELAGFIRNQVKQGNLVFTEEGGLGPAEAGTTVADAGVVEGDSMESSEGQSQTEDESLPGKSGKGGGAGVGEDEKDEEKQSALAVRRSKDEERLKKIMKQREKWGGASAGTGADSLAAPVITPASNSQGFGGIPGQR